MARKSLEPAESQQLRGRRHFLREWRKYRGLTQEQLAERIDVSAPNISLLENGKQNYTQRILEELALALNTEPACLLAEDPTSQDGVWQFLAKLRRLSPFERRQALAVLDALILAQERNVNERA